MTDRSNSHALHTIAVALIAIAVYLVPAWMTLAAEVPPIEAIDTGASCTTSCHIEFAKKPHVHRPARKGTLCRKCHVPTQTNKHTFKPLPAKSSEHCLECHDDEMEATRKHLHKPFKAGKCTKCHDPHQSDHAALLKEPPQQLCLGCHDEIEDESQGKVVHGPVAEGKCVECHDPHQSENASLQKKTSPELCFSCHDSALKDAQGHTLPAIKSLFENKELLHHLPFAEGKCSECHQPHMSVNRRLLTETYPAEFYASYSTEAYGLCYDCHDSKAFDAPRTLTDTRFRNGNLNLHHRHVNREKGRTCGACHSPHVSVQDNLVSQTFQFGSKTLPLRFKKTETGGSCTSACHGPLKYDFCQPEVITLRTTPRQGVDATAKALQLSCEKEKQKGKQEQKE